MTVERILDEIEQYAREVGEEFERTKKAIEEFIEQRRKDIETSVQRAREAIQPAVQEAQKSATIEVKQTPEGKVEAETHGKVIIEDPELAARITRYMLGKSERSEEGEEQSGRTAEG